MIKDKKKLVFYIFIAISALFYIALRYKVLSERYFDHDELQHLNATWNLFNGRVPYRDFFEHHFPWLYYFSSPMFLLFKAVEISYEKTISSYLFARCMMQAYFFTSVYYLYKCIRIYKNKQFALTFTIFYLSNYILILKTTEYRPDVPALLFFVISLFHLAKHFRSECKSSLYLSFLSFGISIMFTQKYLVIAPGFLLLHTYRLNKKPILNKVKSLVLGLLILTLPFIITLAIFMFIDGSNQFLEQNLLTNFKWKNISSHWGNTLRFYNSMKVEIILATLGIIYVLFKSLKNNKISFLNFSFFLLILWFFVSLTIVPISALQFYMIVIPSITYFLTTSFDIIKSNNLKYAAICIIATILIYRDYPKIIYSKGTYRLKQEFIFKYITRNTKKDDIVFSGNPLFATYRKHVGPYQFIHKGVFLMMKETDKNYIESKIMSKEIVPKIINYDNNLKLFSSNFNDFIFENYIEVDNSYYKLLDGYDLRLLKLKEPN